ncbi:MAG: dTMP kinase [Lachnospiraceae bacterium]|nr:dTMP kinase [Lachnospiraceae bacterium]
MDNVKGHFIVFEGIDGSGKTTQINLLKRRIEENHFICHTTKEPTGRPVGCLLRQCLAGRVKTDELTLAALFAADRLDHILNDDDGLLKKLEEGISVISDRYILSTYAYQSVRVPFDWVKDLNSMAAGKIHPDCHIFIDTDPDTALERISKGRPGTELFENKKRLTEVRKRYFELFEELKDTENIIIADGTKSIGGISDYIWENISGYFINTREGET